MWDNQLWEVLLAFICLEINHMGAFLKSALSIDVKNNLKRSTLVTNLTQPPKGGCGRMGSDDQVWKA